MYDEAEYGDTLKSWVVPTYMLCAYINLNPITDFKMPYYDIKLSHPDIIMPYPLHCYGEYSCPK